MAQFILRLYTDEYYQALRRFVVEFTEIECAMQMALWHLSKVDLPVAQAVFSGVRADDACNKVARIAEAENWSDSRKAEWQIIADRLGILRTLRNDILHYGVDWQLDGSWIVTNESFIHTSRKVMKTPVTVPILADATSDLQKLGLHLFHFLFGDAMTPKGARSLELTLRRAWRYKSSRQVGRGDKPPKKRRGRQRLPPSSPG